MIKLIAISGSSRKDSLNKKLLACAVALVKDRNIDIEIVDLGEYDLPIYNGDIEAAGIPDNVSKLHEKFKQAAGYIIATPEYNSSFPPLLKNAIDWVSRPQKGDKSLAALSGRSALIISASPGSLGGIRAVYHLRDVLENISIYVIPNILSLPSAQNAFTETGQLIEDKYKKMLGACVDEIIDFTIKLKS